MIRKRGLPPVFWALFGLLVVAAFTVALGQRETDMSPSVSNYSGSGLAAFFSLLQRAGYRVTVDQAANPELGSHDVAICLRQLQLPDQELMEQADEPFKENLTSFLRDGGRAVVFGYYGDFADGSHRAIQAGAQSIKNVVTGKTLHVMSDREGTRAGAQANAPDYETSPTNLPFDSDEGDAARIWEQADTTLLWVNKVGGGRVVVSDTALPVSNRFLDKSDDAQYALSAIDLVAQPGDRLVFTEASFGNVSNPGFFQLLGNWAVSAWRQLIIVFLVLIYSLGKRFGYPEERRRIVQSSRDLADAYGNLLHRSKRVDVALEMASNRLDQRLRVYLRIPRDASVGERNRLLPEELLAAISRLEAAKANPSIRASEALAMIRAADKEVESYLFLVTHQKSA